MQKLGIVMLIIGLLLGCKPAQEAQETIKDGAKTTVTQPDEARARGDLTEVTAALQSYFVEHSAYPASLDELKLNLYHPEDLDYDPKTGKVRHKKFPDL